MIFKHTQIDNMAKELRDHFVYNEFFVNPNKNFIVNPFQENVRNKKKHYSTSILKETEDKDKPFVELGKRHRKQPVLINIGHKT